MSMYFALYITFIPIEIQNNQQSKEILIQLTIFTILRIIKTISQALSSHIDCDSQSMLFLHTTRDLLTTNNPEKASRFLFLHDQINMHTMSGVC